MVILRPLPMYEVDYRDCYRILAVIQGFHRNFGRWPTRIKLDPALFNYVAREILTPEAVEELKKKVELEFAEGFDDLLAYDREGNEWSYGSHEIPRSTAEAEIWLFGRPIEGYS